MMRFLIEATIPLSTFLAGASTSLAIAEVSLQYAFYAIALLVLSIFASIVELVLDR